VKFVICSIYYIIYFHTMFRWTYSFICYQIVIGPLINII